MFRRKKYFVGWIFKLEGKICVLPKCPKTFEFEFQQKRRDTCHYPSRKRKQSRLVKSYHLLQYLVNNIFKKSKEMGRLKLLEIENFKSYAGKQVLGPFDDFTCVIGPNGSGKSNMMDAISFVLGIQSKHLRSTQLKDLVFQGDPKRNQVPRKAIVKLTYEPSDKELEILDEAVCFSRSITLSGVTNYQINNKDVTFEVYEKTLNSIGVLVQARNFLVFQGDIESIAQKSPVELTKLIEQISGSDALKSEYEELLKQKNEAEEAVLAAMQKVSVKFSLIDSCINSKTNYHTNIIIFISNDRKNCLSPKERKRRSKKTRRMIFYRSKRN